MSTRVTKSWRERALKVVTLCMYLACLYISVGLSERVAFYSASKKSYDEEFAAFMRQENLWCGTSLFDFEPVPTSDGEHNQRYGIRTSVSKSVTIIPSSVLDHGSSTQISQPPSTNRACPQHPRQSTTQWEWRVKASVLFTSQSTTTPRARLPVAVRSDTMAGTCIPILPLLGSPRLLSLQRV